MIPESTEKSMGNETDGKAAHQRCISKQVTTVDNSFILLEIWAFLKVCTLERSSSRGNRERNGHNLPSGRENGSSDNAVGMREIIRATMTHESD